MQAWGQVLGLGCKQTATALTEPVVFVDGIEGETGTYCSREKGYESKVGAMRGNET